MEYAVWLLLLQKNNTEIPLCTSAKVKKISDYTHI